MENKNRTRLFGMLGFAMRAGKIIIGTDQVISALPAKGAKSPRLVILAADASAGTKKKITYKCEFYQKKLIVTDINGEELGKTLGKLYTPAVIAITDDRFAEEILKAQKALSADDQNVRKESSETEDGDTYATNIGKDYSNL